MLAAAPSLPVETTMPNEDDERAEYDDEVYEIREAIRAVMMARGKKRRKRKANDQDNNVAGFIPGDISATDTKR
jgi:hypothetical protein